MGERLINLGRQRQILTQELGPFADALEGRGPAEDGQEALVEVVQNHVLERPGVQIIGTAIKEGITLSDAIASVRASLNIQMGLPPGSRLRDVKDRITGREGSFLLVLPGASKLPERDRKKLVNEVEKLGIRTFY